MGLDFTLERTKILLSSTDSSSKMAAESVVSKTFMNLEMFLQKVAALEIFEALIFNYKVKIDLLEPISVHFLTFVKELAHQLQLIHETSQLTHNLCPEILSTGAQLPRCDTIDLNIPSDIVTDDLPPAIFQPESKERQIRKSPRKKVSLDKPVKPKQGKISKEELMKERDIYFKALSCRKVERVLDEPSDEDVDGETLTSLPFFCCATCSEVYKTHVDYEAHQCKEEENQTNETDSKLLVTQLDRLRTGKCFKCGTCREEYRSYDRIVYHLPRCHGGPYSCELCRQQYMFKKDLNLHKKKKHSREKAFFCGECGIGFEHRTSLHKHQVKRHEQEQAAFACGVCDKTFAKRILLTYHNISVHHMDKKYLCQVCGKKFFNQGSLSVHLGVHTEPKKFTCTYCSKAFQQKEKLLFHTRIHTGERPFLCQTCGKGFIRKNKLNEHMRRHRGEKRFRCDDCDKTYAGSWDLKIHRRKQHPNSTEPLLKRSKTNDDQDIPVTKKPKPSKRRQTTTLEETSLPVTIENPLLINQPQPTIQMNQPHTSLQMNQPQSSIQINQSQSNNNTNLSLLPNQMNQNSIILQLPTNQVLENEVSSRIMLMNGMQLQNHPLVLNGSEDNPRIILLNALENKRTDTSRILVQLENGASELNGDNRVYLQLEQPMLSVNNMHGGGGGEMNQHYIQISQAGVQSIQQDTAGFAMQEGGNVVYTQGYDIGNISY